MKLPNKIKWADIFLRGPSSAIQILFLLLFWLLSFTKDSGEACLHLIRPFKVICSICLLFVILEYLVSQGLVFFMLLQGTLEALPVWRCALALEASDAESWPGPALSGALLATASPLWKELTNIWVSNTTLSSKLCVFLFSNKKSLFSYEFTLSTFFWLFAFLLVSQCFTD